MEIITTKAGIEMLLRWGHFLGGITWIGLLYYFNFVQTEYMKEADAGAKSDVLRKLAPRALWWFRWGAMVTFLTGVAIMGGRGGGMSIDIYVGALLGTLMFLNVWLVIWPNQKIVIASAEGVAAGGEPLPDAADALAAAGVASRSNAMFSVPMLFFMGASGHYPHGGFGVVAFLAVFLAVMVLEYNAVYKALVRCPQCNKFKLPPAGILGPMASIPGVIGCGFGLTVVLFLILEVLT
ncbi:urate hydroxylase PuuD [Methylococcus sp. ANG]|uniref:urate hydroxylase PuuD n=1 Tax=Methylococcus sp. ANG TaxID=3231903 RepID=UPI003459AE30